MTSRSAPRQTARWLQRPWLPSIVLALVALIALFALGGAASAQSGPEGVLDATPWATNFCLSPTQCATGDFNGDGLDDIISFWHSYLQSPGGQVYVRLSNGSSFQTMALWHPSFCVGNSEICKVADFNGDGKDDIISFARGGSGNVWVALSLGNGFGSATIWRNAFGLGDEIVDVGDYNGDGKADISTFTRNTYCTDPECDWGKVYVAISNGINEFWMPPGNAPWRQHFCAAAQICGSGDFNGDGFDDIVAFDKTNGPVWISLSTGYTFGSSSIWRNFFCPGQEVCGVGDFNGDRKDDIITYLRSTYQAYPDPKIGYLYVALSNGSTFPSSTRWDNVFCIGQEICGSGNYLDGVVVYSYSQVARTGDFNGDRRDDVVTFLRSTNLSTKPGWVYVKLAYGDDFVDAFPYLPRARWMPLVVN